MPRPLKLPDTSDWSRENLDVYDSVIERRGKPSADGSEMTLSPFWAGLLQWPAYLANRLALSTLVLTAGEREDTYSHRDREFVDQVLMAHMSSNVLMANHLPNALAVGVRLEAIRALHEGRDEDLTGEELELATFIRQVADGTLTDENWDAMELRLGTRGVCEYAIFVTTLVSTIRQQQVFGVYDPPAAEVDAMLRDFEEGRRALPDNWREHIR